MFTFSDFLKNSGKSFHKNGAQTLKARQPYDLVVKRVSCLSKRRRSGLADLRSGLHGVCNLINSDKYSGALLSKILKTISRILKVIQERIGNQCNSYKIGDISSNLPMMMTYLIHEVITSYNSHLEIDPCFLDGCL